MLIFQSYSGDLGLNSGQPQNVYVLDTSKLQELNSMAQGNGIVLSAQNPEAVLPDNKGKIEFLGYKRYVGLDVRHDPGQNIVLYSFVVAFVGLIVSLFVARAAYGCVPTPPMACSWSNTVCWHAGKIRALRTRPNASPMLLPPLGG